MATETKGDIRSVQIVHPISGAFSIEVPGNPGGIAVNNTSFGTGPTYPQAVAPTKVTFGDVASGGASLFYPQDIFNPASSFLTNNVYTVPKNGLYCCIIGGGWSPNGTGSRYIAIYRNPKANTGFVPTHIQSLVFNTGSAYGPIQSVSGLLRLQAGDQLEMMAAHDDGAGTLTLFAQFWDIFPVNEKIPVSSL